MFNKFLAVSGINKSVYIVEILLSLKLVIFQMKGPCKLLRFAFVKIKKIEQTKESKTKKGYFYKILILIV